MKSSLLTGPLTRDRQWYPYLPDRTNCVWFSARYGIGVGNGSPVPTWDSRWPKTPVSVSQGTGTAQPTFSSSAINGRPAIGFDGTDDALNSAAGAITAMNVERTDPFSIATVLRTGSSLATDRSIFGRISGNADTRKGWYIYHGTNGLSFFLVASSALALFARFGTLSTSTNYFLQFTYGGSALPAGVRCWVNGIERSITNSGNTLAGNNISDSANGVVRVGRLFPAGGSAIVTWNGSIGELVFYRKVLSADELAAGVDYATQAWWIT